MGERNVVPCNGCVACCRTQKAPLYPEHGDDVGAYRTVPTLMSDGQTRLMLARKEDGSCVYLGEAGCTIHARAPWVCRRFDCRKLVLGFGSPGLMVELLEGYAGDAVMRAGLARAGGFAVREGVVPDQDVEGENNLTPASSRSAGAGGAC